MRLSFSTLGCPEWTFEQIVLRAQEYGYDGLELRGIGPELDITKCSDFSSTSARQHSLRFVTDHGLRIVAVDTSTQVVRSDPSQRLQQFNNARENIDLAAEIGASFVRVFGGVPDDGVTKEEAQKLCADGLLELGDYAVSAGNVRVVLETHDFFSRGSDIAEIFRMVDHPNAGVLWDLHHPYRQGELPEQTLSLLKPWLAFTHAKDSVKGGAYCLLGDGDVPIKSMIDLLQTAGYDGWLSLEWEKRWVPELVAPEIAFPQYAAKLRQYIG